MSQSIAEKLCIESTQAEFEGRLEDACTLALQAWSASNDDYDACISAHYVARYQTSPDASLRWNLEALARANLVKDERVQSFYGSLYVNVGYAYEKLGDLEEADRFYKLAAELGIVHRREEGLEK